MTRPQCLTYLLIGVLTMAMAPTRAMSLATQDGHAGAAPAGDDQHAAVAARTGAVAPAPVPPEAHTGPARAEHGEAATHERHRQAPAVLAPGYGALTFEAPAPGSYRLPALGNAADGAVLRVDGSETTLHALMAGRLVLLSFIYTRCPDANGCPLATHVLRRLERRVAATDRLRSRVRFLSLSFDPAHDTPAVMADYAERAAQGRVDWHFLTTPSPAALAPILDAYDQSVIRSVGADGEDAGAIAHILRVFLIDDRQRIRNIYSVPFLHPDVLAADLETLLQ